MLQRFGRGQAGGVAHAAVEAVEAEDQVAVLVRRRHRDAADQRLDRPLAAGQRHGDALDGRIEPAADALQPLDSMVQLGAGDLGGEVGQRIQHVRRGDAFPGVGDQHLSKVEETFAFRFHNFHRSGRVLSFG